MNLSIWIWLFFRRLRWAAWILFLGFSFYFTLDRAPHLNSFGHLLPKTEGPALVAIFAGFFEVMMREKTGLPRPTLGQLIPHVARQTINWLIVGRRNPKLYYVREIPKV